MDAISANSAADHHNQIPGFGLFNVAGFAVYLPVIVDLTTEANLPPHSLVAIATLMAAVCYAAGLYVHVCIRPQVARTSESAAFFNALRQFCVIAPLIFVPFASRVFSGIPDKRGRPAIVLYGLAVIVAAMITWTFFAGIQWQRKRHESNSMGNESHD